MGCFPEDCREGKRPLRHLGKRPIKVKKRPVKEGKRPIKVNGLFSGTPRWWKTAPLKRPIKRSMNISNSRQFFDVYVFVLNSNSLTKNNFHVCVFVSITREIPAKNASYVYLIRTRWRSEFFTYVYVYWIRNSGRKTKECACIFSFGMVFSIFWSSRESFCRNLRAIFPS